MFAIALCASALFGVAGLPRQSDIKNVLHDKWTELDKRYNNDSFSLLMLQADYLQPKGAVFDPRWNRLSCRMNNGFSFFTAWMKRTNR